MDAIKLEYSISAVVFVLGIATEAALFALSPGPFFNRRFQLKVTSAGMWVFFLSVSLLEPLELGFQMEINISQIISNLDLSKLSFSVNDQRFWVNKETSLFFLCLHHCLHYPEHTFVLWRLKLQRL